MSDQPTLDFTTAGDDGGDSLALAGYAQRAYLEYALSVVSGRARPVGLRWWLAQGFLTSATYGIDGQGNL